MSTLDTIPQETAVSTFASGDLIGFNQASSGRTKQGSMGLVIPYSGKYRIFTQYITGSLSALGTSVTGVTTTSWVADIFVPYIKAWTGIGILNGATVGTDKGLATLYDTTGAVLATSALAGVTTVGASAFQQYPFTATYTNLNPGRFWLGYTTNGTTDNFQAIKATTILDALTKASTGQVFGTPAAQTVPTTFTADVGPIAYLY